MLNTHGNPNGQSCAASETAMMKTRMDLGSHKEHSENRDSAGDENKENKDQSLCPANIIQKKKKKNTRDT